MSNLLVFNFELLPTEIFIETFAYLDGYHTYKAFYGLNNRLSTVALAYGTKHIDLREANLNEYREVSFVHLYLTKCLLYFQ